MRNRRMLGAWMLMAHIAGVGSLTGDEGKKPAPDQVSELIRQLGDDKFARREAASEALQAIGKPALEALHRASRSSDDPEIRRRAKLIIEALDESQPAIPCPSEWKVLRAEYGGQVVTNANIMFTHTQATGDRVWITVRVGDKVVIIHHWAHYQLKPSAVPAEIDIHDQLETEFFKGIYAFEGGDLKICLAAPGKPRPETFKTSEDDNCLLVFLTPAKP
jgi:uncharacterized protein (TIGR03067 family)